MRYKEIHYVYTQMTELEHGSISRASPGQSTSRPVEQWRNLSRVPFPQVAEHVPSNQWDQSESISGKLCFYLLPNVFLINANLANFKQIV